MQPSTLELTFEIEPKAVQSARFFRRGAAICSFQPQKVVDYKKNLRIQAINQLPQGFQPFNEPLMLQAEIAFAPPQSMRKRDYKRMVDGEVIPKATRPDVDNLTKGLFDAMNKVLWVDDALVVDYHIRKRYAETPFIRISVSPFASCAPGDSLL